MQRSHTNFAAELSCECTLIRMIKWQVLCLPSNPWQALRDSQIVCTDTTAVKGIPTIQIPSISPVEKLVAGIEFEVDRFRQMINKKFYIVRFSGG